MTNKIRSKTIEDFNDQWKIINELNTNDYLDSEEMLLDYLSDLVELTEINNKVIAEVGSGNGRIVKNLLKHNPKKLYAIEPSENGINNILKNLKKYSSLKTIQSDGVSFKTDELCDLIFSLGVIHHIKKPTDVLKNIKNNLKTEGKIIIWVYGHENNFLYILIYQMLSIITKKLSDKTLYKFASLLNILIVPYIFLCRYFNLPLKKYLIKVFDKCGWEQRKYIIFDQLNPLYSKYYKKEEIEKELIDSGFTNLKFHHRHGYSWTVVGEKKP